MSRPFGTEPDFGAVSVTCGLGDLAMRTDQSVGASSNRRGYLAHAGLQNEKLRDCVLNRTLIDRKTNIAISDHAPSEYLSTILQQLGATKLQELLQSHLLPVGPDSPLWHNDFDAFLKWREAALWGEIREVTGMKSASEMVEEEVSA